MAEENKPNLTCLSLVFLVLVLTIFGYMGPIIEGILGIIFSIFGTIAVGIIFLLVALLVLSVFLR